MTTKTAPRQPELKGMPKKTKSQLRAEEFLAALEQVDIKKEAAEHRKLELIGQLKAEGTNRVTVLDGAGLKRTFVLETLEQLKSKKGKA